MSQFFLQAQPYLPGRVKGPVRIGRESATRDGIVVIEQRGLAGFDGPCSALVVVDGRPFSHAMIRAQGYAIPTIIVSRNQAEQIPPDQELVLDGQCGLLFDPVLLAQYPVIEIKPPALFSPPTTQDGEKVLLRASVANCAGVIRSLSCGASAIGLLRMEYLGANSRVPPGTDFFVNELGACCSEAEPLPLIARLPDFTAAKLPDWCKSLPLSFGSLETRGTRVYEREPFQTLLKHILKGINRCSEYHDLRLLLPFIDAVEEFIEVRDKIRTHLSDMVAIGAMLETTHAVDQVDRFFAEADFIALGTNDIIADLLGCEREFDEIDPYQPTTYQQLQGVAQRSGRQCHEIQVNGQLAAIPGVLPVLLGLGFRIFCVDPLLIPSLGETVRQTDTLRAAELARQVCQVENSDKVRQLLGL